MIYALYIINKAGQVIYQKYFNVQSTGLTSDDYLVLGGLFHGMHTISKSLSPTKSGSGICFLESDHMNLRCLQTETGTKFFLIADAGEQNLVEILDEIYKLYTDYALKNPFYDLEQPIHNTCDKFVRRLEKYIKEIHQKQTSFT